jgi:hypothetical protein
MDRTGSCRYGGVVPRQRTMDLWLAAGPLLATLSASSCTSPAPRSQGTSASSTATATPSVVTAAPFAKAPSNRSAGPASNAPRLAGHWWRADGGYLLAVDATRDDGSLAARYLNPRPIRVERATWRVDDGHLKLSVMLQDRGYPGSHYELTYEPGTDTLFGVYHHLGLKQSFEVVFTRRRGSPQPSRAAEE